MRFKKSFSNNVWFTGAVWLACAVPATAGSELDSVRAKVRAKHPSVQQISTAKLATSLADTNDPLPILLDVALGAASELAVADFESRRLRLTQLRDHFHDGLGDLFGAELHLNGHPAERLPNTLNVSFAGRIGNEVLETLEGVAASTGSACHSGRRELSLVLQAMRVPENVGLGAVRFSLGRWTTTDELDHVLGLLRSNALKRHA